MIKANWQPASDRPGCFFSRDLKFHCWPSLTIAKRQQRTVGNISEGLHPDHSHIPTEIDEMLHKEFKRITFILKDQQIPRKHRETTEQIKEINTGSEYEIHFKKWFWKHNKNLGDKKLWIVNGWSLIWLKDQSSINWCRRCWREAWRHKTYSVKQ